MKIKTGTRAPLRWGRRGLRAVRSLSPAALIATTAVLVFGGVGIAGAATGGNFILGKLNTETSQAYLNNSNGVPLKLTAPANFPPLKVSNSNLVSGLNSQFVGGFSAQQLATGGDGFTTPNTDTSLSTTPREVASTGSLPGGTYYVNATALLHVAGAGGGAFCFIVKGSGGAALSYGGLENPGGYGQAAETVAANVNSGDTLQEWCYAENNNGSFAYNAGINAIRVLSSSGTAPASGHVKAARPGR
jgi:hypothetical protein